MFTLNVLTLNDHSEVFLLLSNWQTALGQTELEKPTPNAEKENFKAQVLALKFPYVKYWQKPSSVSHSADDLKVTLAAVVLYFKGKWLFVVGESILTPELTAKTYRDVAELHQFIEERLGLKWLSLSQGFELCPVHIPKPWGEEIWHTGIEERGVSTAQQGNQKIPLPYVLSLFPKALVGGDEHNLILLKILAPLPTSDGGDLYFELHEQKKEVYVVSEVSGSDYPNGVGEMKLGINQDIYRRFANESEFKRAMLKALIHYKHTFDETYKAIEMLWRKQSKEQGSLSPLPNIHVPPAEYFELLKTLPENIQQKLKEDYAMVEHFCHFEKVQPGDVITVNSLVPHSLLHGVRVVEFQTPHYERLILSFNQKVITQEGWDSEQAVSVMDTTEQGKNKNLTIIEESENLKLEKIATFEDFTVHRMHFKNSGARYNYLSRGFYFLIICLQGKIKLLFPDDESLILTPEKSFFVSANCKQLTIENMDEESLFLQSIPIVKPQ